MDPQDSLLAWLDPAQLSGEQETHTRPREGQEETNSEDSSNVNRRSKRAKTTAAPGNRGGGGQENTEPRAEASAAADKEARNGTNSAPSTAYHSEADDPYEASDSDTNAFADRGGSPLVLGRTFSRPNPLRPVQHNLSYVRNAAAYDTGSGSESEGVGIGIGLGRQGSRRLARVGRLGASGVADNMAAIASPRPQLTDMGTEVARQFLEFDRDSEAPLGSEMDYTTGLGMSRPGSVMSSRTSVSPQSFDGFGDGFNVVPKPHSNLNYIHHAQSLPETWAIDPDDKDKVHLQLAEAKHSTMPLIYDSITDTTRHLIGEPLLGPEVLSGLLTMKRWPVALENLTNTGEIYISGKRILSKKDIRDPFNSQSPIPTLRTGSSNSSGGILAPGQNNGLDETLISHISTPVGTLKDTVKIRLGNSKSIIHDSSSFHIKYEDTEAAMKIRRPTVRTDSNEIAIDNDKDTQDTSNDYELLATPEQPTQRTGAPMFAASGNASESIISKVRLIEDEVTDVDSDLLDAIGIYDTQKGFLQGECGSQSEIICDGTPVNLPHPSLFSEMKNLTRHSSEILDVQSQIVEPLKKLLTQENQNSMLASVPRLPLDPYTFAKTRSVLENRVECAKKASTPEEKSRILDVKPIDVADDKEDMLMIINQDNKIIDASLGENEGGNICGKTDLIATKCSRKIVQLLYDCLEYRQCFPCSGERRGTFYTKKDPIQSLELNDVVKLINSRREFEEIRNQHHEVFNMDQPEGSSNNATSTNRKLKDFRGIPKSVVDRALAKMKQIQEMRACALGESRRSG